MENSKLFYFNLLLKTYTESKKWARASFIYVKLAKVI